MSSSMRIAAFAIAATAAVGCTSSGTGSSGFVQSGPVTFQDVQSSILTPRCATSGCHDQNGAFGLDLRAGQSYANLVGVASAEVPSYDRVDPFNPIDSYLFMKVTDDPRILGDPMPALGQSLSDAQLQLIAAWIADGANP